MKNLFCVLGCVLLVSCASSSKKLTIEEIDEEYAVNSKNSVVLVEKTNAPITLDGKLDEPAWARAQAYDLKAAWTPGAYVPPKRLHSLSKAPYQTSCFKILHDSKNIYVGIVLEDADVVAYSDKDQTMMIQTGDTVELFFKSKKAVRHWELYGAPNGKRTTLVQHGLGNYCSDLFAIFRDDFKYGYTVQGTLNNFKDKDKGFTLEFVIPYKMLEDLTGIKPDTKGEWTLLVARYNYTASGACQYSSFPRMPQIHWHLKEYYADLVFE